MKPDEMIEEKICLLKMRIEQKQSRIDSRIITNGKSLRCASRDIKNWKRQIAELESAFKTNSHETI